ncbi:MAG: hypothetical protein KKF39_06955 [Nanoarchaeota archaeon]|nr:hypothetical protein [Nanoarchaeota archaeon]
MVDEVGNQKAVGIALAPILEITDTDAVDHTIIDTGRMSSFSLTVYNDGAGDISEVSLEHAPNPDGPWEVFDNTYFATAVTPLVAGAVKSLENQVNRRRYLRVQALTPAGVSTATCYLYGTLFGTGD